MSIENGVIGTDGKYPIQDDEALWRIWDINQIWNGEEGENRYVPKINDWVVNPLTAQHWIVDHIDPVSLIPTLRLFNLVPQGILSELDVILGSGPGAPSDVYRVYLNNSVLPHTLSVDTAIFIRGTLASYAKIFKGTDTSETSGQVISKVYDNTGNFVSTAVPLELAAIESHTNYATKVVSRCHCTEDLPTGEIVTLVVYADDGHVVYRRQLLVENTDTIADVNQGLKYISEISLECIWLANNQPDVIEYPLNLPMNSLNMVGVVHYSDGSKVRYPVDGTKFTMLGIDGRLSSIIGQPVDMVLRYALSHGETAYASTGTNNRYITKPFKLVTTNPNYSIAVKLFGYPEWQGSAIGYTMRWFLMNLERNIKYEVTPHVRFAENTGPFDPKLYGYLQRKAVSINLRDVSTAFIPFIHTQIVDINLIQPPSADTLPSWTVRNESSEQFPYYGNDVYGQIKLSGLVNFASAKSSLDEWLLSFFTATKPLYDPTREHSAPLPTHFVVEYMNQVTEYPISSWNSDISIGNGVATTKLAIIRFIRKTTTEVLQLAYAGVILKQY